MMVSMVYHIVSMRNLKFRLVLTSLNINKKATSLLGSISLTGSMLEQVHIILNHAEELYHGYSSAGEWTALGIKGYAHSVSSGTCQKCGGTHDGGWQTCPHLQKEARSKQKQEELKASCHQSRSPTGSTDQLALKSPTINMVMMVAEGVDPMVTKVKINGVLLGMERLFRRLSSACTLSANSVDGIKFTL